MTFLALLVDAFAVYRVTRFVTADTLGGRWLRWPIIRWSYLRAGYESDVVGPAGPQLDDMVDADTTEASTAGELPPWPATLVRCRWCAAVWIALGVTVARWAIPDVWQWIAYGLAVSCAGPLLARLETD